MRALPSALEAHLKKGVTTMCRCWRLTRTDGVVMGFTDHDLPLSFAGVTFSAVDGLEASGDVAKAGLGVGGLEIEGAFSASALEASDLQDGRYDGAKVTLWLVNWKAPSERVVLREGTLGEVRRADGAFQAEVRGPMHALETVRGRVITVDCDADVGDSRCGVSLAALAVAATVETVDGARLVVSGMGDKAGGWAAGGVAVVTSGAAAGARRLVVRHTVEGAGVVLLLREVLPELAEYDEIEVTPGCDKRFSTCLGVFENAENFQGFPHLPGNDRAFAYARSGS
ncbi:MAG: DUF2163 domain-containing protein [Pseudomonadota bacterium]